MDFKCENHPFTLSMLTNPWPWTYLEISTSAVWLTKIKYFINFYFFIFILTVLIWEKFEVVKSEKLNLKPIYFLILIK